MKRILFLIFIGISLLIIYNFFNSIYRLWHKQDLITQAQQELKKVQKENTEIKKQLKKANSPDFVEEQARDKLFLVKPGENTIVIPKTLLPSATPTPPHISPVPNWQKWFNLFLK